MKFLTKNGCDGAYNSFDVHFTSACDNKCAHCIDSKYIGLGIKAPDPKVIADTIIKNKDGYDDVLFLGGEPCLFLPELLECVERIQAETDLKVFVTTSVPKTCYDDYETFLRLLLTLDGMNISVQHHDEIVADEIRKVPSKYDRQKFYRELPLKKKIRVNLNIVKPYLYTKEDITACLLHYDSMGFSEIKLSEIQHGAEYFVSFEEVFDIKLPSAYAFGCQRTLDTTDIIPEMQTPLLLKRSCFMCESTLKATFADGLKVAYKALAGKPKNHYGVVYENGVLTKGWV